MRFRAAAPALALLLTGCAADVTFLIDVRPNGSAVATTREIVDDDLYRMASRQTAMPDPFGVQTMQREGWSASTTTDANGNHVITLTKLLSRDDLNSIGRPTPALRGLFLPLSSVSISRSPGFFVETASLSATAPALLPFVQSQLKPPYDDLASAMLSSAVALHFELRTPGEVLQTNGVSAPGGFVRWVLALQQPTQMAYRVRVVHADRIALVVIFAAAAIVLLLRITLLRQRQGTPGRR
ncbi:MAG TPA: hypothetical protein VKR05_00640 [Candidatus Cybelea sp.]|nr:hypothetical protein [Candidatus Cybelea sp.]